MLNTKNQLIMKKRVLLDERKDLANQAIIDARRDGRVMTELIAYFNSMPVLAPIETAEEAKEFLKAPTPFFEERILRDCGISFPEGAKPRAAVIAAMYEIPHSAFVEKVIHTRIKGVKLHLYSFDEATKKIELLPESEQAIREEWAIFIVEGQETEELAKIQTIADAINELAPRYRLDGTDLHRVVSALRFFKTVPKPGGGWQLAPAFDEIKKWIGKPINQL